ncbi:hypothetical protein [Candidatus Magnetominusculus dajiuhuensis]|uniref:hypothetical protein n=1 Tax=Candidatus Magnetominusculus dajiuhuensis TaxID=3137712 RepID=UPI003B42AA11
MRRQIMHRMMGVSAAWVVVALAVAACSVAVTPEVTVLSAKHSTLTKSESEAPPCLNEVYITPENPFPFGSRAAVFLMKSSVDAREVSEYLTDLTHKLLLQKQLFHIIEKNDEIFNDLKSQMKYARDKKYDIIIVGEIEKIIMGGELRQSMMAIKMRVINPRTEVTLLYLDHCRTAPPRRAISFTDFDGLNFPVKFYDVKAPLPKQLGALVVAEISNILVQFKE